MLYLHLNLQTVKNGREWMKKYEADVQKKQEIGKMWVKLFFVGAYWRKDGMLCDCIQTMIIVCLVFVVLKHADKDMKNSRDFEDLAGELEVNPLPHSIF